MKKKICRGILRLFRWKILNDVPQEDKCVILGVPHTSIWDFALAWLYYGAQGCKLRCMIKKEMFFPPLGWLLRAMGAFPVDRSHSTGLVKSIVKEMQTCEHFHIGIAPEGTRKPVRKWKSGFYYIAQKAGIPVYMGVIDWRTKTVGNAGRFEMTGDASTDLPRLQQTYEEMHLTGKHPGKYLTH